MQWCFFVCRQDNNFSSNLKTSWCFSQTIISQLSLIANKLVLRRSILRNLTMWDLGMFFCTSVEGHNILSPLSGSLCYDVFHIWTFWLLINRIAKISASSTRGLENWLLEHWNLGYLSNGKLLRRRWLHVSITVAQIPIF